MAEEKNYLSEDAMGFGAAPKAAGYLSEDAMGFKPKEPGFAARLGQGASRALDSAKTAMTDDRNEIAKIAADQARTALPQTALQRKMAEEFQPYVDAANKAEGFVDNVTAWGAAGLKRGGQFLSNPAEAGKMMAEQLPNSLPGLAGGFAGMKGGAALGTMLAGHYGTIPGAIIGGIAGGFAGGYGLEKGAAVQEQVQKEAQKRGIDIQDQAAVAGMVGENYDEIEATAQRKGVGTAGTDAILNAATMGLAGMGGRAITKEAQALHASVKSGAMDAAEASTRLAALESANAARNTLGAKALRGTGIVGAEMVGEGASEAVGQKYAYGEVDAGQVIDESFLGLGTGTAMALGGKAFNKAAGIADQDATTQRIEAARADIERQLQDIPEHQQPAARAQLNAELNAQMQAEARAAGLLDEEQGSPDVPTGSPSDYRATPAWAKPPEDAAPDYTSADDEIFQSTGTPQRVDPVREAVRQAADAGGSLSVAAGVAMDSGVAPTFMPPEPAAAAPVEDPFERWAQDIDAAQESEQPVQPAADATPQGPVILGADSVPLGSGGTPFRSKYDAAAAKKMQPLMRVIKVDGGYALAEKTPAQIAAQEKAGQRLAQPRTSAGGEPIPAHAFIASSGGISRAVAPEVGLDHNPRAGNRFLLSSTGMSMEEATQRLIEEGYLGQGAGINDALALIKTSLTNPQYTPEGFERIAQAQSEARFNDYLEAHEDAAQNTSEDYDPFAPGGDFGLPDGFTPDDLVGEGYTTADPGLQMEVNALMSQLEDMGFDPVDALGDTVSNYANATQDEFNAAARQILQGAIASISGNGGRADAQAAPTPAGAGSAAAAQELTEPTPPAAMPVPGNFSGTPSAAMGTRTDAVAGPGFGPRDLQSAIAQIRTQKQQAAQEQPTTPTQQGSAQPAQTQQAATEATGRHSTWRKNAIQAGRVARELGLEPQGKSLPQIVAEIDAYDAAQNKPAAAGEKLKLNIFGLPDGIDFLPGTQAVPASSLKAGDWIVIDSAINSVKGVKPISSQRLELDLLGADGRYAIEVSPSTTVQRKLTSADGAAAPESALDGMLEGLDAIKSGMAKTGPAADAPAAKPESLKEGVYSLPTKTLDKDWIDSNGRRPQHPEYSPTTRQSLIIDAVRAAKDSGLFYTTDVIADAAKRLNVSQAILASNEQGVSSGDFGMDVYMAGRYLDYQGGHKAERDAAQAMRLRVGDKLGVLQFNDYKNTSAAQVVGIEDDLRITVHGTRGAHKVAITASPLSIASAMDRAKGSGRRKDGSAEWKAARQSNQPIEPWQMTRDYYASENAPKEAKKTFGDKTFSAHTRLYYDAAIERHKKIVKQAIADGKPVPADVLNEYLADATAGSNTPESAKQAEAPALSTYTAAEIEAQQAQQEQAAKAEAAAKRADAAAAQADDDRKRIAAASVAAADTFELGQDPMDSLTGQKDVFADAPAQPEAKKAEVPKLPPTDIRIGDKVVVDGEAYTVTGPMKDGKKAVGIIASREDDADPHLTHEVFLRGDEAIAARIAAQQSMLQSGDQSLLLDAPVSTAPAQPAPTNVQEGIAAAQAKAARFAIGKSLTKEQRKQVLESLVDTYKTKSAEREFKGQDSNGNDRYGYAHSPELFEKSDITGAMVRYYVTLPDGRIAHPTELFPDVSVSDVERMALEQESKKKAREAYENAIKPFYPDFDSANLMATTGQVVISKGDRFAIISDRIGPVGQARQQGWEIAERESPSQAATKKEAASARPESNSIENKTESTAQQAQAATEKVADNPTAKRKLPPKLAAKAAEVEAQRAAYFAPGNVVASYTGHDRVVAYTPADAQGNWSVTVQPVEQQGDKWVDVPSSKPRTHSTQPDARAMKAGPVVAAKANQPAAPDTPAQEAIEKIAADAARRAERIAGALSSGGYVQGRELRTNNGMALMHLNENELASIPESAIRQPPTPAQMQAAATAGKTATEPNAQAAPRKAGEAADDLDAMFDDLMAETAPVAPTPRAPRAAPKPRTDTPRATTPKPRTATQAAGSAVKNAAAALNSAIDGLGALFGAKSGGRMGSGLSFDENTYAQAKPLFIQAVSNLKNASADIREAMRAVIQMVTAKFGREVTENMKPYIVRFASDVRDGTISQEELQTVTGPESPIIADADEKADTENKDAQNANPDTTTKPEQQPAIAPGAGIQGGKPGKVRGNAGGVRGGNTQSATGNASRGSNESAGTDYVPAAQGLTRTGSWFETAKRNIDLIELAIKIDAEKRPATPQEQEQLSKYVGFGASAIRNDLFPIPGDYAKRQDPDRLIWPNMVRDVKWKPLAERIEALPREWQQSILQSSQYAHYTSEGIIRSVWGALERMGFKGGNVFEPGMGIGSFAMLMPEEVRAESRYTGIEFDAPTALIAGLLSPQQNMIHGDFIKRKFPKNFFDVNVGNPPFSQTKIYGDPDYAKNGFMLHDFFFAKGIDLVRPGGLQVFVTSKGTMDKQSDKARKYLTERADLLGAIRLPSTAFEGNAGTSVVTDVIFLKKRAPGQAPAGQAWGNVATVETPDGPVVVNEYFAANPHMVLGQQRISGNVDDAGRRINSNGQGEKKYTVVSYDKTPAELDAKFAAAAQKLPAGAYAQPTESQAKDKPKAVDFDPAINREGVIYLGKDGALMRVDEGIGKSLAGAINLSEKEQAWFKSYVGLRDKVQAARFDQLNDGPWEKSLAALNKAYDAFRKAHGPVKDFRVMVRKSTDEDGKVVSTESRIFKNRKLYREDYDNALITSLEEITEDGDIVKAPFLRGRTIGKPVERVVRSIGDALAVSLDEIGALNLEDIGQRLDLSREEAIEALGAQVYQTPSGEWQLADEYLSGDVVAKLEEAEQAVRLHPHLQRNIKALKDVQPEKLGPSQISAKLGASWIPESHVNEFANEIGAGAVTFDPRTETWQVDGGNLRSQRNAGAEYGTAARSPSELLEAILNSRSIKIAQKIDGKTVTDEAATTAANEMAKKIKDKFKGWVWTDTDRSTEMVERYNKQFNNIAPRRFDGSHLTLPGVSLRFKLHPHQLRAIWRMVQTGNTYLAHAVGAGKTIEMIAGGMEQKRLGLIKKPIYVVPNHMLEQFSNEFMELYPMANIMAADDENFSPERRKAFVAAATLNDPDAIVITHDAFQRIGVKEESVAPIRDEILADLEIELSETAKGNDARVRRGQLEQQIEAVKQRFDRIIGAGAKDSTVKFEDMGVDFVFADEAHVFRKLDFHTAQQIKGIDPNGSKRALDMYVKTRILDSRNPGRSMVFASGTPVTNTMGELYTIMRFFGSKELDKGGISTFDAWARQFGEVAPALEPNAAGKYELVERFAKFDNVPELMSRVRQFMDVLTSDNLGALVKRPDIKGGKPNLNITAPNKALQEYMKGELASRIEASRNWKPSRDEPNNPDPIVAIITDGRFAALDPRFFGGKLEDGETSLLMDMGKGVVSSYHATKGNVYKDKAGNDEPIKGSTQLVFYNLGFGEQSQKNRGFNSRATFTKILTDGGIPRGEIYWFDDANTDAKKEAVFKDVRNGKVKVLIGSAKKMGTGVNVQKRLAVLHYQDPPWFPADVEQPHGRIIRQGNQNSEGAIEWYTTKGTYQSTMWQMVGRKQRFIDQAFTGDKNLRSMDDMGEASLFEQAAAVASGDPRAIQLAGLRQDVQRFERLQAAHASEQISVSSSLRNAEWGIASAKKRIATYSKAFAAIGEKYFSFSEGNVGSATYTKPGEFGQAIKDAFNQVAADAVMATKPVEDKAIATIGDAITIYMDQGVDDKGVPLPQIDLSVSFGGMSLSMGSNSGIGADVDAAGLARRIFNQINSVEQDLRRAKDDLVRNEVDFNKLRKKLGAPFEYQQEMAEKYAELKRLEAELQAEGEAPAVPAKPAITTDDTLTPLAAGEAAPDGPAFSRSNAAAPRTPVGTIRAALSSAYGKLAGQLEAKGLVTLTQTQEQAIEAAAQARADKTGGDVAQIKRSLAAAMQGGTGLDVKRSANGAVQGFFDPQTGQSFLVADNLTAQAAPGVLMHEVGIHMAADQTLAPLFNRAAMLLKAQKANPFMQRVQAKMDAAGETSAEEAAAYIVEAYENDRASAPTSITKWLADMLATVKAWLHKNGIMGADSLTVADIAAVARANAKSLAHGDMAGGVKFSRAAANFATKPADRPGTAQDKAVMQAIADSKSTRDVLRLIAGQSKYPFRRQVARLLLKSGITPTLRFGHIGKTEKGNPIHGQYRGKTDTIAIAGTAEYAAEHIFLHEAMHAATMRALDKPGIASLQLRKLFQHVQKQQGAGKFYGMASVDEFVAEVFTNPDFQAALRKMTAPSGGTLKSAWDSFVRILRGILNLPNDSTNALSQALELGVAAMRDDMVLRKQGGKSAGRVNAKSLAQGQGLNFSRATAEGMAARMGDAIKSVTTTNIKERAGWKMTDWLGMGLQALGRRQLVDIYGDVLPLDEYNRLSAQMEADKNEMGAGADKLATAWGKLKDERQLAELMHDATLAQIDPDKALVDGDDRMQYRMLRGRFEALLPEAQQVYRDARAAYKEHHANVRTAIKERIERSELKGARKADLLKRMDDEFFKSVKGVYFPLSRFGRYVVAVKGADGKVQSVGRAETKPEAEALRRTMLTAFPQSQGYKVDRVILSKEFIATRDSVGRGFMTELYKVLDKQDMDAAQRAELEDTLGQLYLSALPDLSWAKHGIHRKGTPGFSQDARRAYAQNMFHGARYLAKLRYSDLMQDELAAMQEHTDNWKDVDGFNQNNAQRVVDEFNKRHESMMNPKGNPISTALTSFGFIFYLGLSPASAMVNLSQTALVAYPVMGAKWGFGKAGAALLKASEQALKGKNDITASLSADERLAYDEAVRSGTIDVTMAHDLAGIAQGEDAGVMWKIRPVMKAASFMFHHAERFNRQVTFIAAYRLAREIGGDHKSAFADATKATYDGHFDYSSGNRPRIMQGNVARVVTLFKQYGQNMVYTLARNAYQSVQGTEAEKKEARKVFAGLLVSHGLAAGALGLPIVTTLLAAASMLGSDDDEPWDAKVALQNLLADSFGQKTAEVMAHGLSRLTPWDVSGRVGLDRLILPDVQEGLEGQRLGEAAMTAALGPVAGIGVNMLKGLQQISEGQFERGLESMLPTALRGPLKAVRYANEGVQDKSGISILDEVSTAGAIGQAMGFSPSDARNAQEGKRAIMAHDRALGERRQQLVTRFAMAAMAKDPEGTQEAREAVARFNEKNPTRRILPMHLMASVRGRQKRIDQAQDGVYLPKNRRDAMEAGRFALGD